MAVLNADADHLYPERAPDTAPYGIAGNTTFFGGSAVMTNAAGWAVLNRAASTPVHFEGVALSGAANTTATDGATQVDVRRTGVHWFPIGDAAQANIGEQVGLKADDDTELLVAGTPKIGELVMVDTGASMGAVDISRR